MTRNVIVLEFNELVPALVDRFMNAGFLPNFAALRQRSIVAVTDAEAEHPHLEPWIQWVTVHTGLSHKDHGVFDLSDGPSLDAPRVWDIASDAGRKVWICGSMNAAFRGETINGMILPDPWATEIAPAPAGLFDPFIELVRPYVQEYTSGRPGVTKAMMMRFARFMIANGLSVKTVADTMRQLAGELSNPIQWRRATILDRLQWDIFRKFYERERPALSTFFLNSTAHYQHYFWRNMEPELFAVASSPDVQAKYADAILFGYRKMDKIIGECMTLAGPETSIVLCTALSQQPMLDHEEIGGKQIFKLRDTDAFFEFVGVRGYEYAPVMAEQFHLFFQEEDKARAAESALQALTLDDGTPVMMARREGNRVFAGCSLIASPLPAAAIRSMGSNITPLFTDHFYPVEAVRSGMHHADGILWVSTPSQRHLVIDRRVSLLEIAPTLLELAGVVHNHSFARQALKEISDAVENVRRAA